MPWRRTALANVAGAFFLAHGTAAMYADEIGKVDWHRENLGRVVSAGFDGQGGLTVIGEASTLGSFESGSGQLLWRRVLPPGDSILAVSAPQPGRPTATLSAGGRAVRMWAPADGSLSWETALPAAAGGWVTPGGVDEEVDGEEALLGKGAGAGGREGSGSSPHMVLTEGGHVVVVSGFGIHLLSGPSGAVLAQWWYDPSREPDLAALVGSDVQVTLTSLHSAGEGGGRFLAGGWASSKQAPDKAEAFVVAEINTAERLVTYKAAKVKACTVNASAGVTLTRFKGDSGAAVVGLCEGGASLAVFEPSFETASVGVLPLPAGLLGVTRMVPSALVDLAGSVGRVLQLRDASSGASVAIALSSGSDDGKGDHVSIVMASEEAREAWSCPPSADRSRGACALAAAVSRSGKVFVGSASMPPESGGDGSGAGGHQDLVVRVASIGGGAHDGPSEVSTTIGASELVSSAGGRVALVEAAFLEAREPGLGCSPGDAALGACFRVLVVAEDDSAIMVGAEGLDWVREEALAAVDQVVFVDSSVDDLALLAPAGQHVDRLTPSWQEMYGGFCLEIMAYLGSALKSLTNVHLPGSDVSDSADVANSSFGLSKVAVCTTSRGKLYAIDMSDGSITWSLLLPSWAKDAKVVVHATRSKAALGLNPEVAVIAALEDRAHVSWRDALTGAETHREELPYRLESSVPLALKDPVDRTIIMTVDGEGGVHAIPTSKTSAEALSGLLPRLFHHRFSAESGLESFAVVKEASSSGAPEGDVLLSTPVATVPLPPRARLVAKAYPDRRDAVQTPAHTLGDDSLIIKYINPRLLAFATLTPPAEGDQSSKGDKLMVTVMDHISGRILHRISHKDAAEPVHMVVSESWIVYSYWSASSHRTEISTLSLYEGMIDKYGLSPLNRPQWKEAFSSFESRAPIATQKTFVFPHPVTALGVTLTQRGITAKNVLVGTALGQVVMMDRRLLDPRRPVEEPSKFEKEERLLQYQPHLPVVPTQVLSYYKVIEGVDRIITEPTGLESTSLVLALGLDVYGSRVAPSKTFDMLDPNFNYALLVMVLMAMTMAVLVASRMAASKRLKDQWA